MEAKDVMEDKDFDQKEVWTSFDFLHLPIWISLPSQLAGPSPVFLGVTQATGLSTSNTDMKPYSHNTNQSFLQPEALNFNFNL